MDTLTRLKNIRLFAALTADNLARVAELATRRSYPKGTVLCRQEEFGETLYIIDSGEAILRQTDLLGVERPIGYLREGKAIGEDVLLLGESYGFCVEAATDVQALCIRKQDFDRLLKEHPRIRKQVTTDRRIQDRLRVPTFPWLGKDETSLLLRRRHWIGLVRRLPFPLFSLLVLAIVVLLLRRMHVVMSPTGTLFFVFTLPALMTLWQIMDWHNDFYLVTTERIIHREKLILVYETSDEAPLSKIQDTRIVQGLIGNLLGFGTMRIDTASARGSIILDYLPDPEGMQEVILKQVRYIRWKLQQEEREGIRRQLLRQTGRAEPEEPPPAPEQVPKQSGFLAHLLPSRPLLRLRYEQADRVVWRKHWLFLLRKTALPLLVVLGTTALIAISLHQWPAPFSMPLLLASVVLCIPAAVWLWWEFEDWRNDEYIVTDRLVIDVQKKPLFFAEERRQASLDMIQNVSLNIPGPLASILNYGHVLIQTAGPGGAISFHRVGNPSEVQSEIFRRIEAYNETARRRDREQRRAEFSAWFQIYDEMNQQEERPSSGTDAQ